jgi:hypothetical protein
VVGGAEVPDAGADDLRLRGRSKPPKPASDAGALDAGTSADAGSVTPPPPSGNGSADGVWTPLTVAQVVSPLDYGAVGNGTTDDLNALNASVKALPANGGIVYLPGGKSFKKADVWLITKSHVKLWSENRAAEIFAVVAGQRRHQAILCQGTTGCGVFGVKLRSDASARFDALEDNQISLDHNALGEVVGNEVQSAAATGVFIISSSESYVEGNYIHHTWADHIHHTDGSTASWAWNNFIFNEAPSKGDDGIACVTYGANSPRCGDMEWWHNTILHTGWGRGYSVIGGNDIQIHDNWAIGVAGAGVIVASEPSYDTSASQNIRIDKNFVVDCGHTIGHPGLLISGLSTTAGPLRDIALSANVSVDVPAGAYRSEGAYQNVTNVNLSTSASALPTRPTTADVRMADTRVLRTRDTTFVTAGARAGLYRIHVRRNPAAAGFQQRFEYVVKGTPDVVAAFAAQRTAAKDYLSEQRLVDGTAYALVLSAAPLGLPNGLSAVSFRELREGDRSGKLSWLWQRLDSGSY